MKRHQSRIVGWILFPLTLAATGCIDALQQGLSEGLRTGTSSLISEVFTAVAGAIANAF